MQLRGDRCLVQIWVIKTYLRRCECNFFANPSRVN